MTRASVILPCAGRGVRVGGDVPKQFLDLGGRPVFHWSLAAFLAHAQVRSVCLVVSAGEEGRLLQSLGESGFGSELATGRLFLVVGGAERWMSVRNGFRSLEDGGEIILVHDVARPFVGGAEIEAAIEAAAKGGACTLAKCCPDTVKRASGFWSAERMPEVESTLDRRLIWLTQTPQAFRREVLESAYGWMESAHGGSREFTDEAGLAEAAGFKVKLVMGGNHLDKITTADDLELARWRAMRQA